MSKSIESGLADPTAYQGNTDWLAPRREEDALSFLLEVSAIYSKNGEYSKSLHSQVERRDFRGVVEVEVPQDLELEDYRGARQIQALFSKQCWLDLGYNPLLEGVNAFIRAEQRCLNTNGTFSSDVLRGNTDVVKVFYLAQRKIASLLGQRPSWESLKLRYGPGANTSVRMAEASLSGKLSASLACSEDMLPYVGDLLTEVPYLVEYNSVKSHTEFPLWEPDPDFVRCRVPIRVDDGKLVFVPKSAKTHRPIIVEPVLNGLFQLGLGSYLKDRLSALGIDLRDQERNRKLARMGSIDGSLSTLDLSSASDTISWDFVAKLLPFEWLEMFGQLRTGTFSYDGASYSMEKFSSMGNGYTFELESAIFYALAWGATISVGADTSNIGVFGDDIIVPTEATQLLIEVLDWCGFWVNAQKSSWSGSFRESCGADWLAGNDVRPFYIRDEISDKTLFCFHNWAMRRGERELAALCHSRTFEHNRLFGPDGYGDGHLLGSHSLYTRRTDRRRGYVGGYFDTYSLKPRRHFERRAGDWLVPVYSVYARTGVENPTDPYVIRGSDGYVRTPIYTLTTTIFCG